eukprot:6475318-Amphidinium_carterae.9
MWTDGSQRIAASGAFAIFKHGQSRPNIALASASPMWSCLFGLSIHQALSFVPVGIHSGTIWLFTESLSAIKAICSKTTFCEGIVHDIL